MGFCRRNYSVHLNYLFVPNKRNRFLLPFCVFVLLCHYTLTRGPQKIYVELENFSEKHIVLNSESLNKLKPSLKTNSTHHNSCQLPKLTPGTREIYDLDYIQFRTTGHRVPPDCVDNNSTMFAIDYESNLIRLNLDHHFWKDAQCFYQSFERKPDRPDFKYTKGREIYQVKEEKMALFPDIEQIGIWCNTSSSSEVIYEDYLSHVPEKPELEMTLEDLVASQNPENYPSILIFGQDSSSHMNFRRYMPNSHEFLLNEMEALEFNGFNSHGDGTLLSLFPFFSGLDFIEFNKRCHANNSDYFDDCPMIWKEFEKLGYRTSYAEDAVHVGIFNTRPFPGFSKQPVHYDLRSSAKLLRFVTRGHNLGSRRDGCYGSRLTFEVLLDNILKTAHTFSRLNKPFWHFSWTAELTHNVNYYSKYGDKYLLRALKELHDGQLLSNTVLILMSDHGMRFGPMRQKTRQGFLEERLPMLYIVLPESLKKRFPQAYKNMKGNTDKLITTFDLHSTMKDLMNLGNLELHQVLTREAELGLEKRRNVSLFLPINENRTCEMTGVASIYCACMSRTSIPVEDPFIQQLAGIIVVAINRNLDQHPQCDQLTLDRVTTAIRLDADISVNDENARFRQSGVKEVAGFTFEIGLETSPGGGAFYASVFKNSENSAIRIFKINRISGYGNDAHCMDIRELWPFCHCRN